MLLAPDTGLVASRVVVLSQQDEDRANGHLSLLAS